MFEAFNFVGIATAFGDVFGFRISGGLFRFFYRSPTSLIPHGTTYPYYKPYIDTYHPHEDFETFQKKFSIAAFVKHGGPIKRASHEIPDSRHVYLDSIARQDESSVAQT